MYSIFRHMANKRNQYALRTLTSIARAVSDENRVRILVAVKSRELCVCQIVELLDLAPSTVSKHLSILKQAYLLDSRRDGRWTYYSRPREAASPMVGNALEWIDRCPAGDPVLKDDAKKLKAITRKSLEEICKTLV